jgi:hypothetical protein
MQTVMTAESSATRHQFDPTDARALADAEKRFVELTAAGLSLPSGQGAAYRSWSDTSTPRLERHCSFQGSLADDLLGPLFPPALMGMIVAVAVVREFHELCLPDPRSKAERRAFALLRSWLTPDQERQWLACGEFEVIGCEPGTRYRLTRSPAMNIHQLDPAGRTARKWCFMPSGGLVLGDVLLAQKIALETMERETLAIANSQSYLQLRSVGQLRSRNGGTSPANREHAISASSSRHPLWP